MVCSWPHYPLCAQNYGEINGTVTDPTGAVITGANVTVTNTATNIARTVQTNTAGNYTVPFLAPGLYDVRAEQAGFKAVTRPGVQLQVGSSARINIAMEVGAVTEEVAVTGAAALLTTEGTAVGTVIENKRIVDLPLNGRDYLQLIALSPGVTAETPPSFTPLAGRAENVPSRTTLSPARDSSSRITRSTASRTPTPTGTSGFSGRRSMLCRNSKSRPESTRRNTAVSPAKSTSPPSPALISFMERPSNFSGIQRWMRGSGSSQQG